MEHARGDTFSDFVNSSNIRIYCLKTEHGGAFANDLFEEHNPFVTLTNTDNFALFGHGALRGAPGSGRGSFQVGTGSSGVLAAGIVPQNTDSAFPNGNTLHDFIYGEFLDYPQSVALYQRDTLDDSVMTHDGISYGPLGDTTPPAVPTGLTASAGNTQVTLDWNDNTEGDLAGYNVYRSTTSGGPYSKVNGPLVTASTYLDTGLTNGTAYYYVITAVDTASNESGNSNEASATPSAPGSTTLLEDGFETDFSKWTDGGTTDWDPATSQMHIGSYSAHAGSADNDLTSDNLDTTGSSSITIEFWYRDDDIDNGDNVFLQLYNGTTYNNRFELGNTSPEDTWHFYTETINNSGGATQYFRSNFRIRFEGTSIDSGESLWIDDVKVTVQ